MKKSGSKKSSEILYFRKVKSFLVTIALPLFAMLFAIDSRSQSATTCTPVMTTGCTSNDYINAFQLNGVSSIGNAGCNGGTNAYTLFTTPVRTLMVGQTYTWSSSYGPTLSQCLSIWIDLNNDGFYTNTEQLANTSTAALSHTGTITIPVTATTGTNIAMRTRCKWNSAFATGSTESCTGYTWGETEDYKIEIIPCPSATFAVSPVSASVCPGNTVMFTASSSGTTVLSYTWTGGVTNGVAFTPTASTVYTVSAGTSGCISTKTVPVTLHPGITINPPNPIICNGSSVILSAIGGTSFAWNTGPVTNTIGVSPSANTGYSLTGVTTEGCNSNAAVNVTVIQGTPTLSVVNSATASGICPGKSTTLTASGAVTYTWSTGPTTSLITVSPPSTMTYVVTGGNICGTTTAAISVSLHPLPTVGAVASTASLCSGSTATVTGTGNASSYTWTTAVTSPTIGNGVSFAPTITNTYITTGTSVLGCTASAAVPITVVTTPTLAPVATPASICLGQVSTLSTSGATNYTWTSSSGVISSVSSVTVSPTNTAAATVYTITKSNSNCVDTKTISVTTNSLPSLFAIASSTVVCASTQATLFVGGASNYTWTSPGPPVFTFTGSAPIVSPPVSTTYTVLGSNGICANTTTVFLATNPNPIINISTSASVICIGQSVNMTASGASGATNYTWTSSSGTVPGVSSINVSPTAPILYSVIGDNNFGCTASASQIVLVNQLPVVTASVVATKTLVCIAGSATLAAGGAHTYQWDPAAGGAITSTVLVNPLVTTIYTVVGTNTLTTCSNVKTVTVNVFSPSLSVSGPSNTCQGGIITLVAGGGNNGSYNWNTGSGFNHQFPSVVVTVTAPAVYTVAANSTSNAVTCPVSQTWSVGVFYNPTVTAVSQRTAICKFESVRLIGGGALNYSWDNNSMTGDTVFVSPLFTSTFVVIGTDANNCADTNSVIVKVIPCTSINELTSVNKYLSVYPNPSDGEFTVESVSDITLKLINELGQEIRSIRLSQNNNHKVSVADLAKGIYFIVGENDDGTLKEKIVITK